MTETVTSSTKSRGRPQRRIGIVRFLGTNCDRDLWQAAETCGATPGWLWHRDHFDASDYDAIVIPGGFSHGDYLRAGALAARSHVMSSVREAAERGVPILGICNGFQILCEAGLLPGALVQNENLRFIDEWSELELVQANSHWAASYRVGETISLPSAHGEGRFYAAEEELQRLEENGQVWWRYRRNPNGSLNDIAGVSNRAGHVVGMMPHPERALFEWMQGCAGRAFFGG